MDCVYGYGVALDMTRRDLQGKAKDLGRPWEVGKAFEASAPCTALVPASEIGHPSKGAIWLDVNGQRRQTGDLILSGTPSGVGAVNRGDKLHGHIDGVGDLEVRVV